MSRPLDSRTRRLLATLTLAAAACTMSSPAASEGLQESLRLDPRQFVTSYGGMVTPGKHDVYTLAGAPGTWVAFTVRSVSGNAVLQVVNQPAGNPALRVLQIPKGGQLQLGVLSTVGMAHYKLDVFASETDPSPIVQQYYLAQQNAARAAYAQAIQAQMPLRPPVRPLSGLEWAILGVGFLLLSLLGWVGWKLGQPWLRERLARLPRRQSAPARSVKPAAAPLRTQRPVAQPLREQP